MEDSVKINIEVSKSTCDWLLEVARHKDDTYDEIILMLLEYFDEPRFEIIY